MYYEKHTSGNRIVYKIASILGNNNLEWNSFIGILCNSEVLKIH